MSDASQTLLQSGLTWLREQALPRWGGDEGFDAASGSFVERFALSGQPMRDHPRRAMTQARQIFVFAKAHRHGWLTGAGQRAELGWNCLVERYWQTDGSPGWVFQCDARGTVIDGRRDFYGQAFCLLAAASWSKLSGEHGALDLADRTLAFMDQAMASPHGGYVECWPETVLPRRQNPHMHLLEALLELHEADRSRDYADRAAQIVSLAERHFLQSANQCLGEYFDEDLTPRNPDVVFEPGHHCEWVWLLRRFDRVTGRNTAALRRGLLSSALKGFRADGLIVDELAVNGRVTGPATRLWPLTEAMKAVALDDRPASTSVHPGDCWDALRRRFLADAPDGCWLDHFSPDGTLLVDFIPASSLYHICCAFDFLCALGHGGEQLLSAPSTGRHCTE